MERDALKERYKTANFVSIICDGSTDVAVIEQELIYIRVCCAGNINTSFLKIVKTPKASANGILGSITQAVESTLDIEMSEFSKKLVSMGTDGAAVMMGKTNGVVAKLQESAPSMVGIHCFAHRLELACRDVVKKHRQYEEIEQILQDLYSFYHKRYVVF